jgi:hypothetical protein
MDAQRLAGPDDEILPDPGEIDLDKLFPPANLMQQKLSAIRNRQLPPLTEEEHAKARQHVLDSMNGTATRWNDGTEDQAEAQKRGGS